MQHIKINAKPHTYMAGTIQVDGVTMKGPNLIQFMRKKNPSVIEPTVTLRVPLNMTAKSTK